MHLTTVSLASLLPPKNNPRRLLDKTQIAGLAQSIRSDGLLQNLLVRPEGEGTFRVISGKRRFLALQLLKKEGAIDGDYQVPVDIRDAIGDHDAMRLATVENVQREQLHPLDEGEAFAGLLQSGGSLETIAEKTGLSLSTLKRRLALATLAPEVKKAFRAGDFGRHVAETLSLGSHDQQRSILESLQSDSPPDAEEIRDILVGQKPTLAMAVFPRERYTGTVTTDLFADEGATYLDDVDQFLSLQNEAVEAMAEERRKTAAFVEVLHLYTVPWWQFREASPDEPSGVVINLHPSGIVEVREGLARHEVEKPAAEATRISPIAPRPARERAAFTTELLRYVACQRSAAVQAALLADPRKGKEAVAVLLLVGLRRDFGLRLTPHACHSAPVAERDQQSYRAIEAIIAELADRLDFQGEADQDRKAGVVRLLDSSDAVEVYGAIRRLSEQDLDRLLILLPLLCLGQNHLDAVDAGDSLFNRIAGEAGIVMRSWWMPDAIFLALLTRDQLLKAAAESGAKEHLSGMNGWTKRRLVEELAVHFADHAGPEKEAGRRACEWLPSLLRFPAMKSAGADTN